VDANNTELNKRIAALEAALAAKGL